MVTKEKIDALFNQLNDLKCQTQKQVEEARVRFLGRKGEITALFEEFRNVDKDMKTAYLVVKLAGRYLQLRAFLPQGEDERP